MNKPPAFLTTKDVSRIFDKSEATIRLWVRLGKLRTIKLPNGQNIFERVEIDRVLESAATPDAAA